FETFYSPVPLQYLGVSAFVNSGLTGFVVDTLSVGNGAFTDCPYLYELHFTDVVEEVDAAVANRCESLYEICYETTDLSFIPNDGLIAGVEGYVTIRVPEGTDEENMARAKRSLMWGSDAEAAVITGECDRAPAELPDVEAIIDAYADDPYIAPEPAPTPEPIEAAPVGEAGEPYLGAWILDEIVVGDEHYSAAEFGMNMTFVFNADGTVLVGEDGESAVGAWSVTGDGLRLDAMGETLLLAPTEDGRLVQEEDGAQMFLTRGDDSSAALAPVAEPADEPEPVEPEPVEEPVIEGFSAEAAETPDLSDYVGQWHGVWLQTGGLTGDPRAQFGLDIVLTLNEDGRGDLDYGGSDGGMTWGWDAESENVYYGLDKDAAMPLFLLEDDFLRYGTQYSGYIVFSKNIDAVWTPEETAATAEPTTTAAPATKPDAPVGDVEYIENKFVCTAAESGGYAIDISMLGGEYSVIFHADGTASFTMVGTELPGLYWTQDGGDYVIDYYGQGELRFIPSGTGLLLDYMGSMQMTFEAE
ncbi:MAG: hypothetical protein IJ769_03710, partial [Clostridia bacterium]|nr:hypothetical protein [Clostridia bacterium]